MNKKVITEILGDKNSWTVSITNKTKEPVGVKHNTINGTTAEFENELVSRIVVSTESIIPMPFFFRLVKMFSKSAYDMLRHLNKEVRNKNNAIFPPAISYFANSTWTTFNPLLYTNIYQSKRDTVENACLRNKISKVQFMCPPYSKVVVELHADIAQAGAVYSVKIKNKNAHHKLDTYIFGHNQNINAENFGNDESIYINNTLDDMSYEHILRDLAQGNRVIKQAVLFSKNKEQVEEMLKYENKHSSGLAHYASLPAHKYSDNEEYYYAFVNSKVLLNANALFKIEMYPTTELFIQFIMDGQLYSLKS